MRLLRFARDDARIGAVHHATGCERCDYSGYKGRTGIHELLRTTEELRAMIGRNAPAEQLKAAARRSGMRTLFEDAMEKVKAGVTSIKEALSVAIPDENSADISVGPASVPVVQATGTGARPVLDRKEPVVKENEMEGALT
jgi:hypothetical protein